ncbi:MAG: DUF1292 domain-containing protein [Oscillospiraceae bacterium]
MAEDTQNHIHEDADDYDPDILTLEDEDGKEHVFEVIDAADIGDKRYLAMVPHFEDSAAILDEDAEMEMVIMRVNEEDGDEYLDLVDDEDELASVGDVFITRLQELFDIDLAALEDDAEA